MKLLKWLEVAGRVLLAGVLIVVNVIMNVIGLINGLPYDVKEINTIKRFCALAAAKEAENNKK